jgi:hypothetical protein
VEWGERSENLGQKVPTQWGTTLMAVCVAGYFATYFFLLFILSFNTGIVLVLESIFVFSLPSEGRLGSVE